MALNKDIELSSGIPVRYHRVVSVNTVTNVQSTIEVASYTNASKREEEKNTAGSPLNIFIETCYFAAPYNSEKSGMTVPEAYAWLKEQEMFSDATDC